MVNYVALGTALLLSAIAGFFSVVGLATIFSGAYYPVLLMAASLELGKVVTVGWLTRNWGSAPKVLRYYLGVSVGILMLITSMGTFGYLSKAHLATTNEVAQSQLQIEPLEMQLALAKKELDNAQTSLNSLDSIIAQTDIKQASRLRNRQRTERRELGDRISAASREVQMVNSKLLPLRTAQAATEAEIGPLKYIAELVYGAEAKDHFDSAVRFVIIILVLVFDPLAIVLLIAANFGLKPQSRMRYNKVTGKLEVNKAFDF